MILISVVLSQFVSMWFWRLTAFIGLNLIHSAFPGFCPATMVMHRLVIGRDGAASCEVR